MMFLGIFFGALLIYFGNIIITYADSKMKILIGAIIACVGVIVWILSVIVPTEKSADDIESIEAAYTENYDFYLDGNEVNENYIDINLYEFTIDEEEKCVYLTRK